MSAPASAGILHKEIADRQRTEEALQETQAGLARVSRVLAMGELVASIAHEVNQPLAAVVMSTSFFLRELASSAPAVGAGRDCRGCGGRNPDQRLISRLRLLFQKGVPDRVGVDINGVIREVLVLLSNEAARKQVQAGLDLADGLPTVLGDRLQLQQVLINLAMSGIDAMRTVTGRPRELLIKSAKRAEGALVQVQDSGTGFDPNPSSSW
jgi:C4-dicarboxylate-specific signal transduction histidine kinase